MKMSNLSIGTRLAAGFGLVLVLLALVVAVGLQRFHDVGRATATLIDDDWAKAEAAATIDTMTRANARRTLELFIAPDDGYRTRVREKSHRTGTRSTARWPRCAASSSATKARPCWPG
jgi:methyl-accepting chemotaxis protein